MNRKISKLLSALTFRKESYPLNNRLTSLCLLVSALTLSIGCADKNTVDTKKANSANAHKPAQTESGVENKNQDKSENYYSQSEIHSLGFRIVKLDDQRSLLCSNVSDQDCVCLESLPCIETGNCIGLKQNVDAFRNALNQKQEGWSVDCRRSEVGRCGNFQYFLFDGDINRRELRWFDQSGHLVAQRNSTDHNEYCDGKARTRFMGKIPKCETTVREELVCGKAETNLANAIEDLRRLDPNKFR